MKRYYYISDSLDVLEDLQLDLEGRGVSTERIHVLTEHEVDTRTHHLNQVESVAKRDMIRYGLRGALVGLGASLLILVVALATGLMATVWAVPILFLAAVIFCFCIWEGGLIGAHLPNPDVRRFQNELNQGQHIFYVDVEDGELQAVDQAINARPDVRRAGTGKPEPNSTWRARRWIHNMIRSLP